MSWIDIAIIIIILFSGVQGMIKGFIITAFDLVGYILAAIIAKIYYPIVAEFIVKNTNFSNFINDKLSEKVSGFIDSLYDSNSFSSIMDYFKIPRVLQDGMTKSVEAQNNMEGLTSSAGNYISDTLSHLFINIISIVVIFILARMVLVLIVNIANKISKLPILNTVNKTSGLFLGVIKGVLIIFIIFTILTPFIIISPEGTIASQTYHSTLGEFFYSNNIIIGFLKERGFLKI